MSKKKLSSLKLNCLFTNKSKDMDKRVDWKDVTVINEVTQELQTWGSGGGWFRYGIGFTCSTSRLQAKKALDHIKRAIGYAIPNIGAEFANSGRH